MAETLVENQICDACGADVRAGALFCYGCGGAVASEIIVAKNNKTAIAGQVRFPEITSRENKNGDEFKEGKVELKQEVEEASFKEDAKAPAVKPVVGEMPELQSAASLRKKSKTFQPKKIAVSWEEHQNAPNIWFILTAVFLTILAAVILFLAMRMK